MQHSFFSRLGRFFWALMVLAIVVLAAYLSLGRLAMANLNAYRIPLLEQVNARLPFSVSAGQLQGNWRSFSPELVLNQLRIEIPGDDEATLVLDQGRISVNVWQSLLNRSPQLNHLELRGLDLQARLTREGKLLIRGFSGGAGQSNDWLFQFLRTIERVTLTDNALTLTLPSGEERVLDLDLALHRTGSHRRMQGTLTSTAGTQVLILADGIGDLQRPETLTGSAYLQLLTPDLDAMRALLGPGAPPMWAKGSGEFALWLTLQAGEPTLEASLRAESLSVYSDDGTLIVPLDEVSVQGQLTRDEARWTLYGSDMIVRQRDTEIRLPRIQLDNWGSALRLRMRDVPLAPVNAIVTGLEVVPEALREIFATLSPRGVLPAVQVSIGDLNQPARDWELDATFEALAVDSFKGAPGVDAATGYAQLKPGGGSVTLDSESLSLDFPSIYHEPLAFDEVYGTLQLGWDAQQVGLASGLLTAFGEEGKAHVLFGLDIPLEKTEAGVEMQLLVGLENSDTQFRDKYIPYTLSPGLRRWLADSIGEGTIEQGAFLWRGSLRRDAAPLRTVQLAFNVSDTPLSYHPQWPSVEVGAGQVLIDDAAVSVWSDAATLYHSRVENMSVELSVDDSGDLQLAIDGSVNGPAADGLRVVNESALSNIVGGAFREWRVDGQLQAELDVGINLSDKQALVDVDVQTRWADADLSIVPGNLTLQNVSGAFGYNTASGFYGEDLSGQLWEQPVALQISQEHRAPGGGYDPAQSVLHIAAQSRLAMDDVRDWLDLDLLAMAQGAAEAEMLLTAEPGQRPRLVVSSPLEGVTTALPSPYGKQSSDQQQLKVEVELGTEGLPISLQLDDRLHLDLQVADGGLRAGGLGIEGPVGVLEDGVFLISGEAASVAGDDWLQFLETYFGLGSVLDPVATDSASQAPGFTGAITVRVDDLRMGTLTLQEREFADVTLQLESAAEAWILAAAAEGLRGSAALKRPPEPTQVSVEYLDLDVLLGINDEPEPESDAILDTLASIEADETEETIIEVPPLDIGLEKIYRGEELLGNATFSLRSVGNVLQVKNLSGTYAGLSVSAQAPGTVLWRQGAEANTHIEGVVTFDNIADTLSQFDYEQMLSTQSGSLDVQLRWPGNPADLALATVDGAILVDIGSGSFPEAPAGAAGALRVVNILNLADIVRRLSMTQLFESGIPFDSVEGEVYLHGGTIEVARMVVDGTSSFQFQGVSEVATQSLNGELVATLPVANNLPWVAALAASLPVAAGVFVVSKVFDKQMSKLSSAVYSIEGTWDEPKVEFDRIFDDEAKTVELPQVEPTDP